MGNVSLENRKIYHPQMEIFSLRQWFQHQKRDLPWRRDPTPYKVWISEVMLQQTQARVVIPYFERWMQRFASIESLALAPFEEVLKAWEGLGYYARVRSLHASAKLLVEQHAGKFPSTIEELEKIPGIGPYTSGAILSFAFHQKAAAVDGNVVRVLTRYFLIEELISSRVQKKLRELTLALLPDHEPWVIMEALIELGATVCQKEPKCALCPLRDSCHGFLTRKTTQLPRMKQNIEYVQLDRQVAVVIYENELLLKQERENKVMADLYEFPYFEMHQQMEEIVEKTWKLKIEESKPLAKVLHSFTRYRVTLFPTLFKVKSKNFLPGYEWKYREEIKKLSFSSGHRRILLQITERC
jgi:A/G-specific adenine glycosylase